jgi:hypothetical protein
MRPAQRTKIATVVAVVAASFGTVALATGGDSAPVAASESVPVGVYPVADIDPVPTRPSLQRASLAAHVPSVIAQPAKPRTVHRTVKKKVKVTTVHTYAKPAGWMQTFARCVKQHESHGNYKAENPTSTASGAYQFIDATWRSYAKRAGFTGYSHAAFAPPATQDAVFFYVLRHGGMMNWKGTHCGFGT